MCNKQTLCWTQSVYTSIVSLCVSDCNWLYYHLTLFSCTLYLSSAPLCVLSCLLNQALKLYSSSLHMYIADNSKNNSKKICQICPLAILQYLKLQISSRTLMNDKPFLRRLLSHQQIALTRARWKICVKLGGYRGWILLWCSMIYRPFAIVVVVTSWASNHHTGVQVDTPWLSVP